LPWSSIAAAKPDIDPNRDISFAGRALLHLNQWRERHSYEAILRDGADVYRQKLVDDEDSREPIISTH